MADGRWRITVTAPDWGQDHLSPEAIVAFVDGELASGPRARAAQHLERCPECAFQVSAQGQARSELRTAGCPLLSSALLSRLGSIPLDTDLPEPPAGLAMTADGEFVALVRSGPECGDAHRREPGRAEHHTTHRSMQRRIRLGTGVAVSGLALGALAFGAPASSPSSPPVPVPAADRGLPGMSGLGGSPGYLDARFQLGSARTNSRVPTASDLRSPVSFDR